MSPAAPGGVDVEGSTASPAADTDGTEPCADPAYAIVPGLPVAPPTAEPRPAVLRPSAETAEDTEEETPVPAGIVSLPGGEGTPAAPFAEASAAPTRRSLPSAGRSLPAVLASTVAGSAEYAPSPGAFAAFEAPGEPGTAAPTDAYASQLFTQTVLAGAAADTSLDAGPLGGELLPPSAAPSVPARTESPLPPPIPAAPDATLQVHQKGWGQALGQQLVWMVHNHAQEAELKVNPPHLGPLEVRLSLHQDQASVSFFCHDATVREALENALPRLREMLGGQGVQLGQAHVSDQSPARQQAGADGRSARRGGWGGTGGDGGGALEDERLPMRLATGRVDHYV